MFKKGLILDRPASLKAQWDFFDDFLTLSFETKGDYVPLCSPVHNFSFFGPFLIKCMRV